MSNSNLFATDFTGVLLLITWHIKRLYPISFQLFIVIIIILTAHYLSS